MEQYAPTPHQVDCSDAPSLRQLDDRNTHRAVRAVLDNPLLLPALLCQSVWVFGVEGNKVGEHAPGRRRVDCESCGLAKGKRGRGGEGNERGEGHIRMRLPRSCRERIVGCQCQSRELGWRGGIRTELRGTHHDCRATQGQPNSRTGQIRQRTHLGLRPRASARRSRPPRSPQPLRLPRCP